MPESLFINPDEARKTGEITFRAIPVNSYKKTFAEAKEVFPADDLLRIYRDMRCIREFETMMDSFKNTGEYQGVGHSYLGPAHLSIGQEAAAVGQAFALGTEDFILGSHRSHGEILAKGFSAIARLDGGELQSIMEGFFGGRLLKVVEKAEKTGDVRELATIFFLYGTAAEILAKETGFNMGLGGSMHAFFTPFGIYPNNAIVGGSAPIAAGCALFKKVNRRNGIVVANIGDGSLGCGPVWEAINFSAMGQYESLWGEDFRGGLPVIFNFMNNQYGMGGQTSGETMAFDRLARFGAGVNADQMHAEQVDGYNPLAVIDAVSRKKKIITEQRRGPVLLDTLTYRYVGHSTSDADAYRSADEISMWKEHDSIRSYRDQLVGAGIAGESDLNDIDEAVRERMAEVCRLAADERKSPYLADAELIGELMFSNKRKEKMDDRPCDVLTAKEDNPRVKKLRTKERAGIRDGKKVSPMKVYSIRDAIFEAVIDKFYEDPTLVVYGEDHRYWGGAFGVYNGFTEAIPPHRFFNAPISEAAICGTAVGYAISGGRVVVELMYSDFIGRAGDEIINQMAKWQAMSAGILNMPLVLRVAIGDKYGAQHSQDFTSLVSHIPGLKVIFPATPYDARGLLCSALNGTDPVIVFEKQKLYGMGEMFHPEGVPVESYEIPIGEPDIKRGGDDITILTVGSFLYRAMECADLLQTKYGISAEIIDARSITPFNYEKVIESVEKTGRIVVAGDACERGSHLNDFAQNISELAFDFLDAPPVVVGARNWITPATELEDAFFPQPRWILDAIHERILPLPGHTPVSNFTTNEKIRRHKCGI